MEGKSVDFSRLESRCHRGGRVITDTEDRAQSRETLGDPRYRGSTFRPTAREKRRGKTIFPAAHGGIRWTFRDEFRSVGLSGCTSESRTCLMELEPFWKFDRREQPTSQSFSLFSPSYLLPCPVILVSPVFPFRVPSKIPVSRTTLIWFRSNCRSFSTREESAADGRRFRKTFLAARSWKSIQVRRS